MFLAGLGSPHRRVLKTEPHTGRVRDLACMRPYGFNLGTDKTTFWLGIVVYILEEKKPCMYERIYVNLLAQLHLEHTKQIQFKCLHLGYSKSF